MPIKAVLFDIGGVVVRSPMLGIASYESRLTLPAGYINFAIQRTSPNGAWQRLERSELPLNSQFYDAFTADLSDASHWAAFHRAKKITPVPHAAILRLINGEQLFWEMMEKSREFDPIMLRAIEKLRESGRFRLGALTNDFVYPDGHAHLEGGHKEKVRSLFDVFVSSAEEGCRKPEEGFYKIALERLGVRGEETVFLDDIGGNLKGAKALGMTTIKVDIGKSEVAVRRLGEVVGMDLLEEGTGSTKESKL